jgi:hypothetical protein
MDYLPGWPQTMIFPISAFQVAGITEVSHRSLALRSSSKDVFLLLSIESNSQMKLENALEEFFCM